MSLQVNQPPSTTTFYTESKLWYYIFFKKLGFNLTHFNTLHIVFIYRLKILLFVSMYLHLSILCHQLVLCTKESWPLYSLFLVQKYKSEIACPTNSWIASCGWARQPVHHSSTLSQRFTQSQPVGRPIILRCGGPMEHISSFVNSLLQPIAKQQPCYLWNNRLT